MPRTTVPFAAEAWIATVKLAWGKAVLKRKIRKAKIEAMLGFARDIAVSKLPTSNR